MMPAHDFKWSDTKETFALAWYEFRAMIAEALIIFGMWLMPEGSEKQKLHECLYEYYLWHKDNA